MGRNAREAAANRKQLDRYTPDWRTMTHANGKPMFATDGTMLDEKGNRSIFDDLCD